MLSQKLSGPGELVRWNEEQRLLLHLLMTEYQLTPPQLVHTFGTVSGLSNISIGKLRVQYREYTSNKARHLWQFLEDVSPARRHQSKLLKRRISQVISYGIGFQEDEEQTSAFSEESEESLAGSALQASEDTSPRAKRRRLKSVRIPISKNDGHVARIYQDAPILQDNQMFGTTNKGVFSLTPTEPPPWPNARHRPEMLFRYHVPGVSRSVVADNGDIFAGAFRRTFHFLAIPDAPTADNLGMFWHDMFNHTDRTPTDTPFISASASLKWVLELAMADWKKGQMNGLVSLIRVRDNLDLYHARSFHSELKVSREYTKGNWKGNSGREWMIYGKATPSATLTSTEIFQAAASIPAIGSLLQGVTTGVTRSPAKKGRFEECPDFTNVVYERFIQAVLLKQEANEGQRMICER